MNEALRLLRRLLRPFGYDVRRRQAYNLLPVKGYDRLPQLTTVQAAFDEEPGRRTGDNLDELLVFLRTCLRAARKPQASHQLTGAPLEETVQRCLASTVASINFAVRAEPARRIRALILDDHSDPQALVRIRTLCGRLECEWTLTTTQTAGQGASLYEQFRTARDRNALCYFCEDDYLHEESAIGEMWSFYRQVYLATGSHLVIHPQEGESLYNNAYYPSYILLGERRRWRTMSHATHVFFTHARVVRDYWRYFENTRFVGDRKHRRLGSESRTTNLLFNHLPGFAPLPALAAHLQAPHTLPPFFDWRSLWERYASRS